MTVDALKMAIENHVRVAFEYAGHHRVVVPMALGRDGSGDWQLRGLQVAGGSSSGSLGANVPKLWKLAGMSNVVPLGERFEIPQQYRRGDVSMSYIEAQL